MPSLSQSTATPLAWAAAGAAATIAAGLVAKRLGAFRYRPPRVWKWAVPNGGKWAAINAPTSGARTEKILSVGQHPIQLYSEGTPNGVKVTIVLEEIASQIPSFDYDAWRVPISGEQFGSGFVEVNPNSKIPCMVDHSTSPPTRVFESGSIMLYLADKYKSPLLPPPSEPAARAEVISWLMWQMGSAPFLGGGFGHFYAYAPQKFAYPIDRYAMETKRQLDVLDKQLAKHRFVAGETFTLADCAVWPWYGALVLGRLYGAADFLDVRSYAHVRRWAELCEQREAVRKGRMVNRSSPDRSALYAGLPALPERHSRADWAAAVQGRR